MSLIVCRLVPVTVVIFGSKSLRVYRKRVWCPITEGFTVVTQSHEVMNPSRSFVGPSNLMS